MRVLFLAPRLPLPADTGGKIRTLNILKQLGRWMEVHLICFAFSPEDDGYAAELRKQNILVTLVPHKDFSLLQKIVSVLWDRSPMSITKYYSVEMERVLRDFTSRSSFAAVHVDHLHMAHYRDCCNGMPCVLDEHNVEYRILERCMEVEKSSLKRIMFANQAGKMKKFEAKKLPEFSVCTAVSQDDKNLLVNLAQGKTKVYVIPNGADTEFFQSQKMRNEPQTTSEESLVFTGSMDWLPNEDAVLFFCQKILPLIWKARPQVKFYVVGKSPSVSIKDFATQDPRIVVTGRVDDVRPLIEQSNVFVVPIRVGGGTRLKILEAMSMEKAVVSTTVGAEGIKHTNGKDILLADEPSEFAKQILFLLDNPQKVRDIGQAARKLVCENYDWNIIGQQLNAIYEEIIRNKK